MNFQIKKIAILICLTLSQKAFPFEIKSDYKSKWAGIEVIGSQNVSAHEIRELLPIRIGDTFIAADAKYYKNVCSDILRKKTVYNESNCSILWYGDNTVYLIVDLVDQNATHAFRKIPNKNTAISKIPNELNVLYKKWNDHASALMSSGNFPLENR